MDNQKAKNIIILLSVAFLIIVFGIFLGIASDQITWADWLGVEDFISPDGVFHRGKTIWDLFELLVFPLSIALAVIIINWWQRKTELEVENSRFLDRTLQDYIDKMESLFLGVATSNPENKREFREIARIRTLMVLRQLDMFKKSDVLTFLNDLKAIYSHDPLINLSNCDLRDVILLSDWFITQDDINFNGAYLERAILLGLHLHGSQFRDANLMGAILTNSDFYKADFRSADLMGAKLSSCNFSSADLRGANLSDIHIYAVISDLKKDQIKWYKEYRGRDIKNGRLYTKLDDTILDRAIYDKSTLWPRGFDPLAKGAVFVDDSHN